MTEDEKRQQKAMLLLEYQEAEHDVEGLVEKARRFAEDIEDVKACIRQAIDPSNPRAFDRAGRVEANVRSNLEAYREKFNVDAVFALLDELKRVREHLAELAARKASLGLH